MVVARLQDTIAGPRNLSSRFLIHDTLRMCTKESMYSPSFFVTLSMADHYQTKMSGTIMWKVFLKKGIEMKLALLT